MVDVDADAKDAYVADAFGVDPASYADPATVNDAADGGSRPAASPADSDAAAAGDASASGADGNASTMNSEAEAAGNASSGADEPIGDGDDDDANAEGGDSATAESDTGAGGASGSGDQGGAEGAGGGSAVDNAEPDTGPADTAKQTADATDKINKISDDDLKKMSASDKAKLLNDLQAGGKPSGDARQAQMKVLRDMQLDPDFKKKEDERGAAIASKLKGNKDLEKARKNWDKLSPADKVDALKKVVAAQSEQYGMTAPEIETEDKPPYDAPDGTKHVENGHFDPKDGKLHLNTNAASKMKNFASALDLVLHENGHNYQAKLIKDLKDGKLKPGDPEYTEATVFAANDGGSGYIQPGEDYNTYVKQPKENHSRTIGAETSQKILSSL